MPNDARAPRCAIPPLRIASINIQGLARGKHAALGQALKFHNLDIVLLQETWVLPDKEQSIANDDSFRGWQFYWSAARRSSRASQGRPTSGVAVAVRRSLVDSGCLSILTISPSSTGRLVRLRCKWGGHTFTLVNAYFPNTPSEQLTFIRSHLVPLSESTTDPLIVAGDFNFVEDPALDARSSVGAGRGADARVANTWRDQLPGLVDIWRHRHPRGRLFSRLDSRSASRIDRYYASRNIQPYVAQHSCSDLLAGHSDHRLLVAVLHPRAAPDRPRLPSRRVRVDFLVDDNLKDRLRSELDSLIASAPARDADFLAWWPRFKAAASARCRHLRKVYKRSVRERYEGSQRQIDNSLDRYAEGDDHALADVIRTRRLFALTLVDEHSASLSASRLAWLGDGERPGPGLTARLKPPATSCSIASLRAPNGLLTSSSKQSASVLARYYSTVSSSPCRSGSAESAVLAALAMSPRMSQLAADELDRPDIASSEVSASLGQSGTGIAPGADGIPFELYKEYSGQFTPLLSRLFSAILAMGELPRGFHAGVVHSFYKKGDRTDPANYRPITLLNTDYRLFTRALAARLVPAQAGIISRTQTAFLKKRLIGENVMTVQLLASALSSQGDSALLALCDFRKAFDTVSREFLLKIMVALGVGPRFRAATALLLRGTQSRVLVNGTFSQPFYTQAGVRQGCPLSPLLYLFVAQALKQFLDARGFSIYASGVQVSALQFADDTAVPLAGPDAVPGFVEAMALFGRASGQCLQLNKTTLLPLGDASRAPPASAMISGLQVVGTAVILGISSLAYVGAAPLHWGSCLEKVLPCASRIVKLPLSAFGRATAVSAYALSRVLYRTEFADLPTNQELRQLQRDLSSVVEHAADPCAPPQRAFTGVRSQLLLGGAREGGFGLLPLREHITARHVAWGVRLLASLLEAEGRWHPWAALAWAEVRSTFSRLRLPPPHALSLFCWRPPATVLRSLSPPLRRILIAVKELPAPDLHEPLPGPGPWCQGIPLWHNPLLVAVDGSLRDLHTSFPALVDLGICTLGDAVQIRMGAGAPLPPRLHGTVAHQILRVIGTRRLPSPGAISSSLDALLSRMPSGWVAAARDARQASVASDHSFEDLVVRSLVWGVGDSTVPIHKLTVKSATTHQLSSVRLLREDYHLAFATDALSLCGRPLPAPADCMRKAFSLAWGLPWDNFIKEVYWRLTLNAIPTAARLHRTSAACLCGCAIPDRKHHFWLCPVAQAVVQVLAGEVSAASPAPARPVAVSAASVWLLDPPPGVEGQVWAVACLAAMGAMESARKRMAATALQRSPDVLSVPLLCRWAVARFWSLIADFAGMASEASAPDGFSISGYQPFLRYATATRHVEVRRAGTAPPTPSLGATVGSPSSAYHQVIAPAGPRI